MENKEFILDQTTIKKLLSVYKLKIPDFQRSFVWKKQKKHQLLESLFKGFPIGAITLYEEKGVYYIIDGLQRINTLNQYLTSPCTVIGFKEFFEKIEDEVEEFISDHDLVVSMTQVKRCIKKWYDGLGSLYEYEKLSVLHREIKNYSFAMFKELGDLELVEQLRDILKSAIEITHDDIALIIYKGEKDDLPELFKNINTGSVALSQYEILQSLWTDYYIDEAIVVDEYEAFNRELELIRNDYEIDAVKENGNFDIFKNIVGLNHEICCIRKGDKLFPSSFKKLSPPVKYENETKFYDNSTVGFEIYSTVICHTANKIVKAVEDIYADNDLIADGGKTQEISEFIYELNCIIWDAIYKGIKKLEEIDYEYSIESKYHSLYIVAGIIFSRYIINVQNLTITETAENREIMSLCLDLKRHNRGKWFVDENRQITFFTAKVKELVALQEEP